MVSEYSIIITTFQDKQSTREFAKLLVETRLAACAQIIPIESVYFWQDETISNNETMLIIKSKTDLFDKISSVIMEHHTYDVPEIVQIPITGGLPEYLKWIGDSTANP